MLQQASINTLSPLLSLVKELKKEEYNQPLPILSGSSIGSHVRHIIEFYLCLIKGIELGIIDYDSRERNIKIEQDKDYSINVINNIISLIENIEGDIVLKLKVSPADEDHFILIPTNLFRELAYNIEHCIHHLAIIKIGVRNNFSHVVISENFGVAYSTIRFKERTQ